MLEIDTIFGGHCDVLCNTERKKEMKLIKFQFRPPLREKSFPVGRVSKKKKGSRSVWN